MRRFPRAYLLMCFASAVAFLAAPQAAQADFLADLAQCGKIQDPIVSEACFADATAGRPLGTTQAVPATPSPQNSSNPAEAPAIAQTVSDDQVKQSIIEESIASYSGNCPCPYNTASNGSRCGKRSAWSKPGGADPICYPDDVTAAMIEQWRKAHGG